MYPPKEKELAFWILAIYEGYYYQMTSVLVKSVLSGPLCVLSSTLPDLEEQESAQSLEEEGRGKKGGTTTLTCFSLSSLTILTPHLLTGLTSWHDQGFYPRPSTLHILYSFPEIHLLPQFQLIYFIFQSLGTLRISVCFTYLSSVLLCQDISLMAGTLLDLQDLGKCPVQRYKKLFCHEQNNDRWDAE